MFASSEVPKCWFHFPSLVVWEMMMAGSHVGLAADAISSSPLLARRAFLPETHSSCPENPAEISAPGHFICFGIGGESEATTMKRER